MEFLSDGFALSANAVSVAVLLYTSAHTFSNSRFAEIKSKRQSDETVNWFDLLLILFKTVVLEFASAPMASLNYLSVFTGFGAPAMMSVNLLSMSFLL